MSAMWLWRDGMVGLVGNLEPILENNLKNTLLITSLQIRPLGEKFSINNGHWYYHQSCYDYYYCCYNTFLFMNFL